MDALTREKERGLIPLPAKRVVSDNVDPGAANNSQPIIIHNPSATSKDSVYLRIADPI